eukprot:scaffold4137_cov200-Alexandrium_tamarense.AAC.10
MTPGGTIRSWERPVVLTITEMTMAVYFQQQKKERQHTQCSLEKHSPTLKGVDKLMFDKVE